MKKEDIITLPEPKLRQRSKKVGFVTDEVREFIEKMRQATIDWEDSRDHEAAVGLAAIQLGELQRIFIVRNDFENIEDKSFTTFINPKIVKKFGGEIEDFEGCLSVPDVYGKVKRAKSIKVEALNEDGKSFRVTAHNFLARILQHEVDHTHGVVFIDHIKNQSEAFFKLDEEGSLKQLDYEVDIRNNKFLWEE